MNFVFVVPNSKLTGISIKFLNTFLSPRSCNYEQRLIKKSHHQPPIVASITKIYLCHFLCFLCANDKNMLSSCNKMSKLDKIIYDKITCNHVFFLRYSQLQKFTNPCLLDLECQ